MDLTRLFISYVFSFCLSTLLLVYALRLPSFMTQETSLVDEYYNKNAYLYVPLDFVLVAIYLAIAAIFIWLLRTTSSNAWQLVVVLVTTLVISGLFMWYFRSSPSSSRSFFSRWFHAAGWKAVFYDMIYVTLVFIIMMQFYYLLTAPTGSLEIQ